MKRFVLLLLACALGLSGCGEKLPEGSAPSRSAAAPGDVRYVEDAAGLARVRLAGGEAAVALVPSGWSAYPNALEADVELPGGVSPEDYFFPVEGLSGKVRDACVGEITGLAASGGSGGYPEPAVIFLMEDGSLEWLTVDPGWFALGKDLGYDGLVSSRGRIPWIEDIVSLSWENEAEGTGEDTAVYAQSGGGTRYNLKYPLTFSRLIGPVWQYNLVPGEYVSVLRFEEDGTVSLGKGRAYSDLAESYQGAYRVCLAEDGADGARAGAIAFDLTLDWSVFEEENRSPASIRGTYFAQLEQGAPPTLHLWLSEGDPLDWGYDGPMEEYVFAMADLPGGAPEIATLDDGELTEYLLATVPEAKSLVEESGMAMLVTGDVSEVPGAGVCRSVWLGTNHNGAFVREVLYAVDGYGQSYRYDASGDRWDLVTEYA